MVETSEDRIPRSPKMRSGCSTHVAIPSGLCKRWTSIMFDDRRYLRYTVVSGSSDFLMPLMLLSCFLKWINKIKTSDVLGLKIIAIKCPQIAPFKVLISKCAYRQRVSSQTPPLTPCKNASRLKTRWDSQMSRSESNHGRVKPMTFKLILVAS